MANIRVLATDLEFPEGPVVMPDGSVVLVEIRGKRLTRVYPDGRKEVVAQIPGGPNGAALGLLCAWLVDDRLAVRRGEDRENDLLGVYVIAAVLVLLSLTTEEANIGAAVGGALAGAVIGLLLPRLTRKA